MNLLAQARRTMDENRTLSDDEAQQIFKQLEEIVNSDRRDGTFVIYREEAIAAGIALLVIGGRDWLSRNSAEESLCLQQLLLLGETRPKAKHLDSPESAESAGRGRRTRQHCDPTARL
jgi:hypothetical protein